MTGSTMRNLTLRLAVFAVAGYALAQRGTGPAGPPSSSQGNSESMGAMDFLNTCGVCHGRIEQAPPIETLQRLSPEKLYETITTGNMKTQAAGLNDAQKVKVVEWVSGRRLGAAESGDAKKMANSCPSNSLVKSGTSTPGWNGWSADAMTNRRFQPAKAAGLTPASVARLEMKWAFGIPGASSMYGQPTIVDGNVFIGSDSGFLYALDAVSGCVHWSFQAQAGLRSTPMLAPAKPGSTQMAAFFGDIRGNAYSVDASSGELLWKVSVDSHPLTRITAGVKVYNGRVYVPVANLEEPGSTGYDYLCCTSRGIVVVLDAATGKQIWKTYTITEKASPQKTSKGVDFLGPSGASVWGSVTLDPKRRAVYVSTGNAFSAPDVGRADAVMAMDMDTGKILWVQQAEHGDVWHSSNCGSGSAPPGLPPKSAGRAPATAGQSGRGQAAARGTLTPRRPPPPPHYYCPEEKNNPDYDFSAGVMLVDLPNGKSLVVAGQKSGVVWAYDPDKKGELVWSTDISRGQITFGAAADDEYGYFGLRGGALAAVRLKDGVEQWNTYIEPQPGMESHRGVSAAVSVTPGVVWVSGLDGTLRAFSAFNGKPLWQYDTTQEVKTVNGVPGKGGSIGSAGATIANGMVYVTSGYIGFQSGQPGNLLFAFGPPNQ
jgi:polyvinyl alcohol dehydrogenase (cytochrome)